MWWKERERKKGKRQISLFKQHILTFFLSDQPIVFNILFPLGQNELMLFSAQKKNMRNSVEVIFWLFGGFFFFIFVLKTGAHIAQASLIPL